MSDLFVNKVAGAALATGLALFGLNELSHVLYHPHELEEDAYAIEVASTEGGGGGVVVDAGPVDYATLISAADAAIGERASKKCASCHSFEKGGADMVGPHLYGVLGRTSGSVAGFAYSGAMKDYGKTWSYENMDAFLENPRGYIKGTAMSFAGLKKQDERMALIAYLRQMNDAPPALPAPLAAALSTPATTVEPAPEAAESATPAPTPEAPATPAATEAPETTEG